MAGRYYLETLGCPKNQVDSDKLEGTLRAGGLTPTDAPDAADVVVVNTCAFIEAARQESIDTILALADARRPGARLVVTGCLAERYGDELAHALPEVDLVAGFGVPLVEPNAVTVTLGPTRVPVTGRRGAGSFDLLELPRPAGTRPWAYLKVAEGCDRRCGFCAIPSFRGAQRSRPAEALLAEVDALGPDVREVVLVAQDLASWGLDRSASVSARRPSRPRPIVDLVRQVAARVERVRLLYLYPSALDDELIEAVVATGVPYFDLSLQHVSRPLLSNMRRWGEGARFLERIEEIRAVAPDAALRSSFILGYPGETEDDHDRLLEFLGEARLDWAGFFPFSEEPGTYAADPAAGPRVETELAMERLRECAELQDAITAENRAALVGAQVRVLVDAPGAGRTHREAPEIDGIVNVPEGLRVGDQHDVVVTG
ncbi:MAG TPA: MiaB/RimO family radical SAM methylthiotransferase, partial [Acidimicrobiales bacterium]|nr:MiaB/RimO family radical SAM methylthiotransferase [Acidimicrobiales bacterium]